MRQNKSSFNINIDFDTTNLPSRSLWSFWNIYKAPYNSMTSLPHWQGAQPPDTFCFLVMGCAAGPVGQYVLVVVS